MPASLDHISDSTPMGANLSTDGATFRVWAPNAHQVHVCGEFNGFAPNSDNLLTRDSNGHWRGFVPGVQDRQRYKFFVVGDGGSGFKRDPFARELATPFPSDCIIRGSDFPWHQTGFLTPQFHNLVIYQLHVGVFFTPNLPKKAGTFLDVAPKIPYLDAILRVDPHRLGLAEESDDLEVPRGPEYLGFIERPGVPGPQLSIS